MVCVLGFFVGVRIVDVFTWLVVVVSVDML